MATTITKVKILLDEHQEPFIPFVTTDSVFKNGTDEVLTDYIDDYIEQKEAQVDAFLDDADTRVTNTINQANQDIADTISQANQDIADTITDVTDDVAELIRDANADVDAIIADLEYKRDHGYFTGPQGPQGIQGEKGDTGDPGVYYGPDEPTNPDIGIWIDTADPVALAIAEESDF